MALTTDENKNLWNNSGLSSISNKTDVPMGNTQPSTDSGLDAPSTKPEATATDATTPGTDAPINKDNYITEQLGKGPTDPTKNQNVNTGSGAQAAKDTTYSWETKAAERAQLSYKSDVLKAKQDALAKRQEIETQAQQYQMQSDMQKYADNQSAEKAGWAGGYVLDQNRQRQYLQQSINASMFNSMQLQKYGYESQLQAARIAYDSNMMDLAMEYYQQAVQNSINEAQVTGLYMSAEQKDMLSQWNTANAIIGDATASDADKEQAQKVSNAINSWFAEQKISPAGIKTLGMISAELEVINMKTAVMEAAYNRIPEAARNYTFVTGVDENGEAILINFNTASPEAILDYINQEGSKGETAKGNLNQYFQSMMNQIITDYANSTTNYSDEGFKKYTEEHKELQNFINMFESEDTNSLLQYINSTSKFVAQNFTNDKTNKTTRFTLSIGEDGKFIWKSEEQSDGAGNGGGTGGQGASTTEWKYGSGNDGVLSDYSVSASGEYIGANEKDLYNGAQESFGITLNVNEKSERFYVKTSGALCGKELSDKLNSLTYDNGEASRQLVYFNGKLYVSGGKQRWQEITGNGDGAGWDWGAATGYDKDIDKLKQYLKYKKE